MTETQTTITIGGRPYPVVVTSGDPHAVEAIAQRFDERVRLLTENTEGLTIVHAMVLAALRLEVELEEAGRGWRAAHEEAARLREIGNRREQDDQRREDLATLSASNERVSQQLKARERDLKHEQDRLEAIRAEQTTTQNRQNAAQAELVEWEATLRRLQQELSDAGQKQQSESTHHTAAMERLEEVLRRLRALSMRI